MNILSKIGDLYMVFRSRVPSRFTGERIVHINGTEIVHTNYLWTDRFFNARPDRFMNNLPMYEQELVEAIESYVQKNDHVTIIGGGLGVTAIKSSKIVGSEGTVNVYEGSKEFYDRVRRSVKHNNMDNIISVNHAIVGEAKELYGEKGNPDNINPNSLQSCDVLEMDCEGSELYILENMNIRPRCIIVETHGIYGSPTEKVKEALKNINYNIVSEKSHIEEEDVKILVAVQEK